LMVSVTVTSPVPPENVPVVEVKVSPTTGVPLRTGAISFLVLPAPARDLDWDQERQQLA
jgi:hypothetical protein